MTRYDDEFCFNGDLEEEYRQLSERRGRLIARFWYWLQLFYSISSHFRYRSISGFRMLKSYLLICVRNLRKHKIFTFINIAGLAVGMAVCVLILMWVQDQTSYDVFHTKSERLFRVNVHMESDHGILHAEVTPFPLADAVKQTFPEIENSARYFHASQSILLSEGRNHYKEGQVVFTEPSFFSMFDFKFAQGDPWTAFSDPNSIVLTREMAEKIFGAEDPMGKKIRVENRIDFRITGLIEDFPHNTNFRAKCFFPIETLGDFNEWFLADSWESYMIPTYILLREGVVKDEFEAAFKDFLKDFDSGKRSPVISLQNVKNLHLFLARGGPNDSVFTLVFISAFGLLILIVACMNFINLSTARGSVRAREVGMRKVLGARRKQLIQQFLGESLLFAIMALLTALVLIYTFIPFHNAWTSRSITLHYTNVPFIIAGLAGITLFTGLVSGLYPALFLSSFQPASVVKGFSARKGKKRLRRFLVVTQLFFSVLLIFCASVLSQQVRSMVEKDHRPADITTICLSLGDKAMDSYEIFKTELLKHPEVIDVTASSTYPRIGTSFETPNVTWPGKPEVFKPGFKVSHVHKDYFSTADLRIVQGRSFSDDGSRLSSHDIILNEKAAEIIGEKARVGNSLTVRDEMVRIVGIVEDYHFQTVAVKIEPLILMLAPEKCKTVSIRVRDDGAGYSAILSHIEAKWKAVHFDHPFDYHFLDEFIQRRYDEPRQFLSVINVLTILAFFISCLGILGLSAYTAELRKKEIGIRKVLGSSVYKVLFLLAKEFIRYVLIASLIAWILGYGIMTLSLQQLAFHIRIGIIFFIISGAVTLAAAIFTVSFQVYKTAKTNPVDVLRYE